MSKQPSGGNSGAKVLNGSKQFLSAKEAQSPEQRMLMLENNLSRVCLQQDALMPLLQMIEYIPYVQKAEVTSRQVLRRLEEHEARLALTEKASERKGGGSSNGSSAMGTPGDAKGLRRIEKSLGSLSDKICELEAQVARASQQPVGSGRSSAKEDSETNSSCMVCKEGLGLLRQEFQQEFRNVYREINGLRNDVEFITNEEKKKKMQRKIAEVGNQMNSEERVYVINFMEQEQFIDDLEYFEKENTFRLNYELDFVNMQIDRVGTQDAPKSEQPALMEKLVNLKYQTAASKKKYMSELRKIEQKFVVMEQLAREHAPRLGTKGSMCLATSETLQQKVARIVEKVHFSMDQLSGKLAQAETRAGTLR